MKPKDPVAGVRLMAALALALIFSPAKAAARDGPGRWTPAAAQAWAEAHPWSAGCNYIPSTAINQLEMWQGDTFDPATIDRELGWAEEIGFTTVRVFLHNLAWREDPSGFLDRMDRFLAVADRHRITVMFVIFDACWNPFPVAGPQPAPRPHVHNSGWVQSPGREMLENLSTHGELEAYTKTVLSRFRDDRRIVAWDLFNEPGNSNGHSYGRVETPDKSELSLILLKEVFQWGREVHPLQPLTAAVWSGDWGPDKPLTPLNDFMLANSDVISFHCYSPLEEMESRVAALAALGRPLFCTEYMARPEGSRFSTILPFLKSRGIFAYNWGFVQGKTQTIYPWDSWQKAYAAEPPEWFHDVLRTDGSPYHADEVAFLKKILRPEETTNPH